MADPRLLVAILAVVFLVLFKFLDVFNQFFKDEATAFLVEARVFPKV